MKETRERILEAGLKLFSKKGYLGATTKDIARTAGVAELTLFRQFSSKEKLFGEVISAHSFLPALKGLLPELKGLEYSEALSLIASRFLDRLSERRELIRIMHSEHHLYPAKVKAIYHRFIDEIFGTLASYFRELQDRGMLRRFDPEFGARAFLGMFFSFFNVQELFNAKGRSQVDRETAIREFVSIFCQGTVK